MSSHEEIATSSSRREVLAPCSLLLLASLIASRSTIFTRQTTRRATRQTTRRITSRITSRITGIDSGGMWWCCCCRAIGRARGE